MRKLLSRLKGEAGIGAVEVLLVIVCVVVVLVLLGFIGGR